MNAHASNLRLFITSLLIAGGMVLPRIVRAQEIASAVPDTAADTSGAPPLTSGTGFRGDLLRELPIDDASQAFVLAPGVLMRGGEIGIATTPALSLRGGAPGAASVYIDGAPVRFQTLGTQQLGVGLVTSAIDQVSVVTGPSSALVSDASGGGVISYVTRAGGARFTGTFRAASDEAFGDATAVGYNRFEATLGGPLLTPHLTWFVSAALLGQGSDYRGLGAADQPTYVMGGLDTTVNITKGDGSGVQSVAIPKFVQSSGQCAAESNDDFPCQGLRWAMDWSTARRGQAKLLYTYGAGSSVSITGVGSDLDHRTNPGSVIGDPSLYRGASQSSRLAVVNWTQGLRSSSNGALRLHVNGSVATDEQLSGVLDPASELTTRAPGLGINFKALHFIGADIIPLPLTDEIIRNVRVHQGLTVPYVGRSDLLATQAHRTNPYGLSATARWFTLGVDDGGLFTQMWERRWNGRAFIEWRPGALTRLNVGADLERTDLSHYTAALTDEIGLDAFVAEPRRWGLFADYQISGRGVVIDLGVRFDQFDPGGEFPEVPGFISKNPEWSPLAATSDTAYANSVARVFDPAKVQGIITPRFRMSYAMSSRTSLRFGVGQQVERPSLENNFTNVNSDFVFTSNTRPFGRDVEYVKSTLLDFGVQQALGSQVVLDASVYHKSHLQPYFYKFESVTDPTTGGTKGVLVLASHEDPATGLDTRLVWSHRSTVTASLTYSLFWTPQISGAASPNVTTSAGSGLLVVRIPNGWHSGTALGAALQNLSAVATFRLTSGLPYTRLVNVGAGTIAPAIGLAQLAEPINSSRAPTTKTLDLKVGKAVHFRAVDVSLYADLRNVLNARNALSVFAETGTTTNDEHRKRIQDSEINLLLTEAQANNALLPDHSVNLGACATWMGDYGPVNCVALRRVEARFGDGNGVYSPAEQTKALDSWYDALYGAWGLLGPGTTARLGMELRF